MRGVWLLAWRHLCHSRVQTSILIACITVVVFLPVTSQRLTARYSAQLSVRADETPLLLGALGNRFDLTLQSLYFRPSDTESVPWSAYTDLLNARVGLAIPLHVRFTARERPIVATTVEYFEARDAHLAKGYLPRIHGEAVLGSQVAAELELQPGATLFSDQKDVYDISKPPALKMHVVGILAPTGTPDDHAVFTDINTAWILEGFVHGHDDPSTVEDPALLYGRTDDRVVLSEALMQYNEVTAQNAHLFHLHGDRSHLPLTSVLLFPNDDKAATLIKARVNTERRFQMLVPRQVIDDLMAFVFRVKAVFDALSAVLGASTAVLTALVMLLSLRLRRAEIETLHRIGCSRFMVLKLCATELALIVLVSIGVALLAAAVADLVIPDLLYVI